MPAPRKIKYTGDHFADLKGKVVTVPALAERLNLTRQQLWSVLTYKNALAVGEIREVDDNTLYRYINNVKASTARKARESKQFSAATALSARAW